MYVFLVSKSLSRVSVLSAAVVVGKGGAGSGTRSSDWWEVGGARLSTSYWQAICCPMHNYPIDVKAHFPALSPGRHMLTYSDVVMISTAAFTHTASSYRRNGRNMLQ